MNVENSVAIVTGSSSGVGAATARMLAAKGGRVVINYSMSVDAARVVAAECEALGGETLLCQANVANDNDCRRMVAEALNKWGRLDTLVNNAGTTKFVQHADMEGLDAADFQNIYGVNVVGPFQMARAASAALKASGDASVVNVSSIAGVKGVGSSISSVCLGRNSTLSRPWWRRAPGPPRSPEPSSRSLLSGPPRHLSHHRWPWRRPDTVCAPLPVSHSPLAAS